MAKKIEKEVKGIQYAKDCIHAGDEIYELIKLCKIRKIGCHSQSNCIYYKSKPTTS